jgi:hypothetical protein
MRNRFLMATAALALFAGTSLAVAQQEPHRGGAAERMAPKAPGGTGAEKSSAIGEKGAPARAGAAEHKGEAGDAKKNASQEGEQRSNRAQAQPNRGRSETTGQASPSERRNNHANEDKKGDRSPVADKSGADHKSGVDQKAEDNRGKGDRSRTMQERGNTRENGGDARQNENARQNDRAPTTTGQGAAPTKGNAGATVNLTPEKRTRIHDVFVREGGGPRVDHVDFDLSVGIVVPRTIQIVAVPTEIIEIEPEWRGYDYFIVNSEIIIVEPRSMEIVFVFEG